MRFRNILFSLMGFLVLLFCAFSTQLNVLPNVEDQNGKSTIQESFLSQRYLSKNKEYFSTNEHVSIVLEKNGKDGLSIYQTYKTVVGKNVYRLFEEETLSMVDTTHKQ